MPEFRLTRIFTFDAAHALSKEYVGKCSNIHGHTWKVELTAVIATLDRFDMGIDFSELKEVAEKVKLHFDHKLILHFQDDRDKNVVSPGKNDIVLLKRNPTVEALCLEIRDIAWAILHNISNVAFIEVTVWETPDSKCKLT